MLTELFTSKTRIKLLLKLFLNPGVSCYLRELADEFSTPEQSRFAAGSMGPSGKLPSANDPTLSDVTYDDLARESSVSFSGSVPYAHGGAQAINETVTYEYDDLGRVTRELLNGATAGNEVEYEANGLVKRINNVHFHRDRDATGRGEFCLRT